MGSGGRILGHWSWCCACVSRSHVFDQSVRCCIGSGKRMLGGETWGAAGAGTMYSTTGAGATQGAMGAGATKDTAGAGAKYSTTGARWSWCCAGAGRSHVFDHCVRRCVGSGKRMLRHWSWCCTGTCQEQRIRSLCQALHTPCAAATAADS